MTEQQQQHASIDVAQEDDTEMSESLLENDKKKQQNSQQDERDAEKKKVIPIPKLPTSQQLLWLLSLAKNEVWLLIIGSIGLIITSGMQILVLFIF